MSPYEWEYRAGTDSEGTRFRIWVLFDGSGRILAKTFCPLNGDEFIYRDVFFLGPEIGAQRFAEQTVSSEKAGGSPPVESPDSGTTGLSAQMERRGTLPDREQDPGGLP